MAEKQSWLSKVASKLRGKAEDDADELETLPKKPMPVAERKSEKARQRAEEELHKSAEAEAKRIKKINQDGVIGRKNPREATAMKGEAKFQSRSTQVYRDKVSDNKVLEATELYGQKRQVIQQEAHAYQANLGYNQSMAQAIVLEQRLQEEQYGEDLKEQVQQQHEQAAFVQHQYIEQRCVEQMEYAAQIEHMEHMAHMEHVEYMTDKYVAMEETQNKREKSQEIIQRALELQQNALELHQRALELRQSEQDEYLLHMESQGTYSHERSAEIDWGIRQAQMEIAERMEENQDADDSISADAYALAKDILDSSQVDILEQTNECPVCGQRNVINCCGGAYAREQDEHADETDLVAEINRKTSLEEEQTRQLYEQGCLINQMEEELMSAYAWAQHEELSIQQIEEMEANHTQYEQMRQQYEQQVSFRMEGLAAQEYLDTPDEDMFHHEEEDCW